MFISETDDSNTCVLTDFFELKVNKEPLQFRGLMKCTEVKPSYIAHKEADKRRRKETKIR